MGLLALADAHSQTVTEPSLPIPTGPHPVGTTLNYWTDHQREMTGGSDRILAVQMWYPASQDNQGQPAPYLLDYDLVRESLGTRWAEIVAAVRTNAFLDAPWAEMAPVPIVFLEHGLGQRPGYYSFIGEELASHGYGVVAIAHPSDSATLVYPGGNVVAFDPIWQEISPPEFPVEEQFRLTERRISAWTNDVLFVLDRLEAETRLASRMDLDRVAIAGHSVGGKAAVATCLHSTRFQACANLDGWPLPAFAEVNGLTQPYLQMEDVRDVTTQELESWNSSIGEYAGNMARLQRRKVAIFEQMKSAVYQVTVPGIRHAYFSDLPLLNPSRRDPAATVGPAIALETIRKYLLAFLDLHLRGKGNSVLQPDAWISSFGKERFESDH